jgi:PST family polysaccharide transporter
MTEPPSAAPTSLTARTIRGVAWTLPTSLATRVIGLVGTLLLARWVAPDEYGVVTAASIATLTAFSVTTFGVGIYLLSNRDLSRADIFHATCWFVSTGVVALAIVWALSEPLGAWLDAPTLGRFMPVLVASVLLDRVAFVPERMLLRKLQFGRLSVARAAGELTYTAVSLALAISGHGAMSIAWGSLARAGVRSMIMVSGVGWREWLEPHRLRLATLAKVVRSGVSVSVTSIAQFLMRRWDNLLISALFGNAAMGAYNLAYNLADTPAVAVGEQMSDVVAASFPHAEPRKRQDALVRACLMISLVMFPLAFGLGAVAETAAEAFLDRKWAAVGPMLAFLAMLSAPRPMAQIVQSYFYAGQRLRVVPSLEWMSLGIMMAGIATIGRLGILWACGAVGVAFLVRTLALLIAVHRIDGIPLRRFVVPLLRPLAACVLMVAAILVARPGLAGLGPLIRLVVEVALGAAVYLAGARLIFRSAAVEFLGLVRSGIAAKTNQGGSR